MYRTVQYYSILHIASTVSATDLPAPRIGAYSTGTILKYLELNDTVPRTTVIVLYDSKYSKVKQI